MNYDRNSQKVGYFHFSDESLKDTDGFLLAYHKVYMGKGIQPVLLAQKAGYKVENMPNVTKGIDNVPCVIGINPRWAVSTYPLDNQFVLPQDGSLFFVGHAPTQKEAVAKAICSMLDSGFLCPGNIDPFSFQDVNTVDPFCAVIFQPQNYLTLVVKGDNLTALTAI